MLIRLECGDAIVKANQYQRLRELFDVVRTERDQATGALFEYREVDAARIQALQEVTAMKERKDADAFWSYFAVVMMAVGVASIGGALACGLTENCAVELVYAFSLVGTAGSVGSLVLLWWRF